MNHEDAVELLGNWGGYSVSMPRELSAALVGWTEHWRKVFDDNETTLLREVARVGFLHWGDSPVVNNNEPNDDEYGRVGLYDSEGRNAVYDYLLLRMGFTEDEVLR